MSAPYKAMDDGGSRMNVPAEVGALVLRLTVCVTVVHHGLQKLQNPEGFAQNMVAKWFPFLPAPLFWTYAAAGMEIVAPILLGLGVFARLAALGLLVTMVFANAFHFLFTGSEGYPLGVPASGAYAFEPSLLCGAIFAYFLFAGPGRLSLKPGCC
uniref:DoxX family protein n=1 Tax=Zooxanthella nutricula TaxID=1333877 RepID=A0A7S2H709_9DINO